MKFGIIFKTENSETIRKLNYTLETFNYMDAEVLMIKNYSKQFNYKNIEFVLSFEEVIANSDIVIAIGGDGTIMHCAKLCAQRGKPIFGINSGHLGFLASLKGEDFGKLKELIDGEYKTSNRIMLKAKLLDSSQEYFIFNDLVISRSSESQVSRFDLIRNYGRVSSYYADGIIVSTPTGSTAYSLSAGGPIVEPEMKCMVVTPICPHSLTTRSIIMNSYESLFIEYVPKEKSKINIMIDGSRCLLTPNKGKIEIQQSSFEAKFITLKDSNFYSHLNEKLISKMHF